MAGPVAAFLTLEAVTLGWLGTGAESQLEGEGVLAESGSCRAAGREVAGLGSSIRVIIVEMARTRSLTSFRVSSRGECSWEDGAFDGENPRAEARGGGPGETQASGS